MDDEATATLVPISTWIEQTPGAAGRPDTIVHLLNAFIDANDNPTASPNFQRAALVDDVRAIGGLLADAKVRNNDKLAFAILRTLKIVSRKVVTRASFPAVVLSAVIAVLKAPRSSRLAREAASVLLNLCYERQHVEQVVQEGAVAALAGFLPGADTDLQAAAAGALQSICVQPVGKAALIAVGAIADLVPLLDSPHPKLAARAAGTLHNVSSEAAAVPLIRDAGALPPLVRLLRTPAAACSAAGAVQNVSREPASREQLRALEAVPALAELLFSADAATCVAAVGALLNISAPPVLNCCCCLGWVRLVCWLAALPAAAVCHWIFRGFVVMDVSFTPVAHYRRRFRSAHSRQPPARQLPQAAGAVCHAGRRARRVLWRRSGPDRAAAVA